MLKPLLCPHQAWSQTVDCKLCNISGRQSHWTMLKPLLCPHQAWSQTVDCKLCNICGRQSHWTMHKSLLCLVTVDAYNLLANVSALHHGHKCFSGILQAFCYSLFYLKHSQCHNQTWLICVLFKTQITGNVQVGLCQRVVY